MIEQTQKPDNPKNPKLPNSKSPRPYSPNAQPRTEKLGLRMDAPGPVARSRRWLTFCARMSRA